MLSKNEFKIKIIHSISKKHFNRSVYFRPLLIEQKDTFSKSALSLRLDLRLTL
jgi:hypothetical protein